MTDDQIQPRRRRRSSITERIQRAFHVDRSDKKRQSFSPGDDPKRLHHDQPAQLYPPQSADGLRNHPAETTTGQYTPTGYSVQDETLLSTLTYSSQDSRLPSTYTPGSSPSVRPAHYKDEHSTPRTDIRKSWNKDDICSSPTCKEMARKERRATKRLEAERKELEKRLQKLEESQARLENGIYERQPRRLTKKQPLDNATRSSSANSERPRSSRSLSAFFSGSRRSSRSRASSATGNERRRSPEHENQRGGGGPPTLPLSLPERFGTAVSRELASRHGTSLMPSHQLQRTSYPLHHTAAKSDDLRENWRMAEAWQRQNSEREAADLLARSKMGISANVGAGDGGQPISESSQKRDEPPEYPSSPNSTPDLDRELFTASLRQEVKPSGSQTPKAQSTPRQGGFSVSQGSLPKDMRNVTDPVLHAHQKEYKSSPLSLDPVTADESDPQKENKAPLGASGAQQNSRELVPRPLRINFEFSRGRNRQASHPAPSNIGPGRVKQIACPDRATLMGPVEIPRGQLKQNQRTWDPKLIAFDKSKPTALEMKTPPSVIPPLKHPGRKYALAENSPYGRFSHDGPQFPIINTTDEVPVTHSQESVPQIRHSLAEIPASQSTPNVLAGRVHSRSSSGASSYNTADEEVLDTPNHPRPRKDITPFPDSHEAKIQSSPPLPSLPATTATLQDSPITNETQPTNPNPNPNPTPSLPTNSPPLAPDGIVSKIRRTPIQRPKQLQKDQLLAKVFVICCRCHHWHDLPSELYAKLACPERIPSDSQLVRTISRRNPMGRRSSMKKAVFGASFADANGRRLPVKRQGLTLNELQLATAAGRGTGAGQADIDTAVSRSASLACCWCGHGMNRACCQGWTTLVQMRERHH